MRNFAAIDFINQCKEFAFKIPHNNLSYLQITELQNTLLNTYLNSTITLCGKVKQVSESHIYFYLYLHTIELDSYNLSEQKKIFQLICHCENSLNKSDSLLININDQFEFEGVIREFNTSCFHGLLGGDYTEHKNGFSVFIILRDVSFRKISNCWLDLDSLGLRVVLPPPPKRGWFDF